MDPNEINEKIEDYIKGKLNEQESQQFQSDVEADPLLAGEVNLHQKMMEATGDQKRLAFRRQLLEIADEVVPLEKKKKPPFNGLWLIGGILIIVGLGLILLNYQKRGSSPQDASTIQKESEILPGSDEEEVNPPIESEGTDPEDPIETEPLDNIPIANDQTSDPSDKPEEPSTTINLENQALAMNTYQAFDPGVSMGENPDEVSISEQAQQLFRDSSFNQVITLLENPPEDEKPELLKIRANAYFELKQFDRAAQDFKELRDINLYYKSNAEWNLLLCYLAQLPASQNDFDPLFKLVLDESHSFSEKAKKLQQQLEDLGSD